MPDWGTLDPLDEDPEDPPPGSLWGNLTNSSAVQDASSPNVAMLDWGVLDGAEEVSPAAGVQAPGHVAAVPPPRDLSVPPAEATASLLADGDVLWARIARSGVSLGSGQPLLLEEGVPAGQSGWCRVQVIDGARLLVRVLPVAWEEPRNGVGDDPVALYRPAPLSGDPAVRRAEPFPVGRGPDLQSVMEARVSAAEAAAERRARAAEYKAQEQAEAVTRSAQERVRQAEAQARQHINAVSRDLDQRLAEGSTATIAAKQQAEHLRVLLRVCIAVAAIGWLIVLILH